MRFPHFVRGVLGVGGLLAAACLLPAAPAAAASDDVLFSTSPSRSNPSALAGATLTGTVYVFWSGDDVTSVSFAMDPTVVNGQVTSGYSIVERVAPYDFARTKPDGGAYGYDAASLKDGKHELAVRVARAGTAPQVELVDFEVGGASDPSPEPSSGKTIVSADFNDEKSGAVSPASFNEEVGSTNTNDAAFAGMTYVADDRGSGKIVRTHLAAGKWIDSSGEGRGNVLMIKLPGSYDTACMSYDVRFESDFEFSAGGKLPGFVGVAPGTPPSTPEGGGPTEHGWSGRLMWLGPSAYRWAGENGNSNMAVTYLYHPGQTDKWGDNLQWHVPFVAGRWHHVQQCHTMNDVGQANGILQSWIDGQLVLDRSDVVYRTDPNVHITHFDWSIFRGGNTSLWASSRDGYVDMDNLTITRG